MLIGILVMIGVVFGPRLSEGAISSCSVNGNYKMSGFALGDTEVFGSLDYAPNGPCTGGTFTGSVTVKVSSNPPVAFVPTGTYVVNPDRSITITNTGGVTVTLTGNVSQVVNDIANAIHVAGDVGGAINVGLTMTRSDEGGRILGRSADPVTVSNLATPAVVFSQDVPGGTLVGGKLLRGRLLYDYTNNTGSFQTLTIALSYGGTVVASQQISTTSSGFALGELEFVLGDTLSSQFQNGGITGVHSDVVSGPISWRVAGTSGESVNSLLALQLRVTHGTASASLTFRKLLVVLELI
jgi:hypothetical protein